MSISHHISDALQRASWIRQMFEKGQQLKEEFGADQVFDFSLGNPVLEPPREVFHCLMDLLKDGQPGMHRYMPNGGFPAVRDYIARQLRHDWQLDFQLHDIVMSVGAGGGINCVFKSLLNPGDEVVTPVPFFVEYGFYAQNHGGALIKAATDNEFQLNMEAMEKAITFRTKVVIINSPNNPTGVVYSQESLDQLGELLKRKEQEHGHDIYLLSDEPYRHILFDGLKPASIFKSYHNSILVTSHSKDLGLAGERIGFIAVSPNLKHLESVRNALVFSTRVLGFVNAPALMQRMLPLVGDARVEVGVYQDLRDYIHHELNQMGLQAVRPQGAFYIFPKAPIEDDVDFVHQAQNHRVLLVPGSGFGLPGHFRLAYCTSKEAVEGGMAKLRELMKKY